MRRQPILFRPIYRSRVWGGRNLETVLGRDLSSTDGPIGESWDISDRDDAQSIVAGGEWEGLSLNQLWIEKREEIFGAGLLPHPARRFPLLMKILDACDDLSIQVHPPARVAAKRGGEPKNEMWYVAHAEPGAKLYIGVKEGVTRSTFEEAIRTGTTADAVNVIEAQKGDFIYIPSGRLHAIGKGLIIFEVQQNSDTTYRVFDWNRKGLDGRPRDLHIEESLESIDFDDRAVRSASRDQEGRLVSCEDFEVSLRSGSPDINPVTLGTFGSNLSIAVIDGSLCMGDLSLTAGDYGLIPACLLPEERQADASAKTSWLEIRIPPTTAQ